MVARGGREAPELQRSLAGVHALRHVREQCCVGLVRRIRVLRAQMNAAEKAEMVVAEIGVGLAQTRERGRSGRVVAAFVGGYRCREGATMLIRRAVAGERDVRLQHYTDGEQPGNT
mgnify:CR=1 FL=1